MPLFCFFVPRGWMYFITLFCWFSWRLPPCMAFHVTAMGFRGIIFHGTVVKALHGNHDTMALLSSWHCQGSPRHFMGFHGNTVSFRIYHEISRMSAMTPSIALIVKKITPFFCSPGNVLNLPILWVFMAVPTMHGVSRLPGTATGIRGSPWHCRHGTPW